MSKASFNPAEMSATEAVDLLVKTAEVSFAAGELVKEAKLPGFLNELINPTGTLGHTARNALIGSGVGGLVGAMREAGKPEEERSYSGGIGRGALLGGLAGGAGTLLYQGAQGFNQETEAERIAKEIKSNSDAVRTRAQAQAAGTAAKPHPGASPHRGALANALNSDYMPPALRVGLNPQSGPVTGLVGAGGMLIDGDMYSALASTPVSTGTGALVGASLGDRYLGKPIGSHLTTRVGLHHPGIRSGVGRRVPFRGLFAPDSIPGRTAMPAARVGGGVVGGLGGAFVGQGIQHLIQKLRGG